MMVEKKHPLKLPFKFSTHGSPEKKKRGLNKLSTEFSWIQTGRNPFGHPVLHRFEVPQSAAKKMPGSRVFASNNPTWSLVFEFQVRAPGQTKAYVFITWYWWILFFLAYRIYV